MPFARRTYVILCWTYLVLLPVQFALAGAGVMGGNIESHMAFGGMLLHIVLPALMLVTALLGRAWALAGWALILFLVLTLQIAIIEIGRQADSTLIAGLHPVVALLTWPMVYFVMLRNARASVAASAVAAPAEPAPTTA